MVEAALAGHGVALAPARAVREADGGARPFATEVEPRRLLADPPQIERPTPAMAAFEAWLLPRPLATGLKS